MLKQTIVRCLALAKIVILDGLRCHTVLGLSLIALAAVCSNLFFYQFIPRNIDQFTIDFILSIGWMSSLLFLLFHAVGTVSWGSNKKTIFAIMARPLSRANYVVGHFIGLALLLFLLNCIIALLGIWNIDIIRQQAGTYFPNFYIGWYAANWLGMLTMELMILAVIIFFSSIIRGSFPVMLLALCYYFACNGLPVIRETLANIKNPPPLAIAVTKWLTLVFPDFSGLDLRETILNGRNEISPDFIVANSLYFIVYIIFFLYVASFIYKQRDLV